jgi:lysophospholipid acyltransferase (LPLAT)-like uncharacterized protein
VRWSARVAAFAIRKVLEGLALTWRFEWAEGCERPAGLDDGQAAILAFWHQHIPTCAWLVTHGFGLAPGRCATVISASQDGDIATAVVAPWGVDVVRGSSSRGGAPALRGLLRALRRRQVVALTPDGPRGPVHIAKPGVLALAQRGGVPIVTVAAWSGSCWRLRSWDRMEIPKPFATVRVGCGEPFEVGAEASLDAAAAELAGRLAQLRQRLEICPEG